jgi:pimeloyl-ACP methyl ester carboxylesterase
MFTRFGHVLPMLLIVLQPAGVVAQVRSMTRDPTLDNLRHEPGVTTGAFATLGAMRTLGEGPRRMILIPGLGFDDGIWTEFMERHKADSTMYSITLPGFGNTAPLPMPAEGTPVGDTPWTRSTIRAIEALLDQEHLARVTIVAHWALATQIALRLALDHPDRIEAMVIIGGPLRVYDESPPGMLTSTAAQRSQFVEGMGQRWFKTVTRRTWDDNSFMSHDYATSPRRGLFLWREAQAPSLPVWIRYLLEFYSFDMTAGLKDLKVPTLVVQPGFDDPAFYVEPDRNYMRNLCIDSRRGAAEASDRLEFVTIPRSRLFIMFDQPEDLDRTLESLLRRKAGH